MTKSNQSIEWHLRVLIYPETEGGKQIYCAHCLDFDLVEGGETPEKSIENLEGVIREHINYAITKDLVDHLYNPAPPEYWNRFYKAHISTQNNEEYKTIAPEIAYSKLIKKNAAPKTI